MSRRMDPNQPQMLTPTKQPLACEKTVRVVYIGHGGLEMKKLAACRQSRGHKADGSTIFSFHAGAHPGRKSITVHWKDGEESVRADFDNRSLR